MKCAVVDAEQKWIGKPSTKILSAHYIMTICIHFWFFKQLFFGMHNACASNSCSHTYRKKTTFPITPLPILQFPSHSSMHTHVVLFCTKGDHGKWCSYIEGDLFWQHSTVVGKPLFWVKQTKTQVVSPRRNETTRARANVLCIWDGSLEIVPRTENDFLLTQKMKMWHKNDVKSKRGSEPKLMNKQSQRMVYLLKNSLL